VVGSESKFSMGNDNDGGQSDWATKRAQCEVVLSTVLLMTLQTRTIREGAHIVVLT